MSDHSPESLLAEGALRLDKLGNAFGVAFLEGEDDRRALGGRFVPHEQLVVTDGKARLVAARRSIEPGDESCFVFLADCDFDVPARLLSPEPNLLLTRNPSLETDLVEAGLARQLVEELVPRSKWHHGDADRTAEILVSNAVALAEGLGKIRHASRCMGLALDFTTMRANLRRYRRSRGADLEKMLDVLAADREQPMFDREALAASVADTPSGLLVCDGHDLEQAIAAVLREDFGLSGEDARAVPRVLRASLDRDRFEGTEIGQRLVGWQGTFGRRILT